VEEKDRTKKAAEHPKSNFGKLNPEQLTEQAADEIHLLNLEILRLRRTLSANGIDYHSCTGLSIQNSNEPENGGQ
jgi:hypothetical protein